jgi:hypothetical protein
MGITMSATRGGPAIAGKLAVPVIVLLVVGFLALPKRRRAEPCPDGTFAVGPAFVNARGTRTGYRIVLADSQASIPGFCDAPVAATVRAKRKVTVIRAKWTACRGAPSAVRLRARIRTRDCNTMRGLLRIRRARPRGQRFTAIRSPAAADFARPATCATCHPRQFREWQGSMMAYAAVSPTANALEAAGNRLLDGAFAADGTAALLCQQCHAPVSVALGEMPSYAESNGRPSRDFAGDVGVHGLSCDFCHQVAHADLPGSVSGDGIANAAFVLQPGTLKFGPFADPLSSRVHDGAPSEYLRSSEFCGGCHDVRLPGDDALTGEPFRRLENAFTEWQGSVYATTANPFGQVVTCQDCHMSAYPYAPPGTYYTDTAAAVPGAPERRVSSHYFTGVDVALVDFPGQDDEGGDSHGEPIGQRQRREDLLRATCTLDLDVPQYAGAGSTLPIVVVVTNSGAGHNVPTGFSQERQMWIELTVTDGQSEIVYQSGHLVDRAHPETGEMEPDGNLADEDLQNWIGLIDPETLEAHLEHGPDRNRRPEENVNLGLVNFGNEFLRVGPHGVEEVFVPFLANAMDNTHSIPPLATERIRYDVPLPDDVAGPLRVSVRLRFRAFPPRFLRTLARARPDLLDEAVVDRNHIVDMATAEDTVTVRVPIP